jgi:hypothetical protein
VRVIFFSITDSAAGDATLASAHARRHAAKMEAASLLNKRRVVKAAFSEGE